MPRSARRGANPTQLTPRPLLFLLRHRRIMAAIFLALAAAAAVHQLTPESPLKTLVLQASRDLPVGATIRPDMFSSAPWPHAAVPEGTVTNAQTVLGRKLAAPLRKGQPLNEAQILGLGLLLGSPPGTSAVPIRISDPASTRILRPGLQIRIVVATERDIDAAATAQTIAERVTVLWLATSDSGPAPLLGGASGNDAGLILVAASPQQAPALAGAATKGKLFFVLEPG